MKNIVLKALFNPIVVVTICVAAAATSYALTHDSVICGIDLFHEHIKASNKLTTKVYSITEKYDEINVSRGIKVVYQVTAGTASADVTAPDNIIDYVEVSVKKGELRISLDEKVQVQGSINTTVVVSGPAIGEYSASSAGQITVESPVKLNGGLEVSSSSAANIVFNYEVTAKSVEIESSSASKVKMASITADKGEIEVSSAANVSIGAIKGGNYELDCSSASSADLSGCDLSHIEASASSGARITMSGKCDQAELDASSGASISCSNLTAKKGFGHRTSSGGRVKIR